MARAKHWDWAEAQKRGRLSDEAVAMAKELGMTPKSIGKILPNRDEPWKGPAEDFIRREYEKRERKAQSRGSQRTSP